MIKRIFFDVGNVLFNDDAQAYYAYRWFHEEIQKSHPNYSFHDMLAEREELASRGESWNLHAIVSRYLPEDAIQEIHQRSRQRLVNLYDTNHLPNPGMEEMLRELSSDFRLGVIANQPPECRESLRRRGLLDYFDVTAISEEINLYKPSPAFYQWALDRVEEEAAECVMVGDRRDNDIEPARQVGMKTIWINWPKASVKNWLPSDELGRAFMESCDRVSLFNPPRTSANEPDRTVSSLWELPAAVRSLQIQT